MMQRDDDYGGEGELLPENGGSVSGMATGNGKVNWDAIRFGAQYLIYPIAAALVYLVLQNADLKSRLSIIEYSMTRPVVDIEMVKRVAVIEDRQTRVVEALRGITEQLESHREKSTYDRARRKE